MDWDRVHAPVERDAAAAAEDWRMLASVWTGGVERVLTNTIDSCGCRAAFDVDLEVA